MKKFLLLVVLISLLGPTPFFAEENGAAGENNQTPESTSLKTPSDFSFSASPKVSYKSGMNNEYVFVYDDNNEVQKLSELNWEIKNLIRLGFDFTMSYKAWDFKADFLFGIKNKNGSMRDSDWMNYTSAYNYIDPSVKTTYSISSLELLGDIKAEITASYSLKSPYLTFSPYISFDYNYTDYSSFNTEGWHGETDSTGNPPVSWSSPDAVHYPVGTLGDIDYTKETFCFYLGINNYTRFSRFAFSLDIGISPFIYVSSLDLHKYPGGAPASYYLDKMYGFFSAFKINFGGELFITENSSFYISFLGNLQNQISGKTLASTNKENWYNVSSSFPKCSGEYFEAVFGWRYRF
jgi:outer membrane protease